MTINNYTRNGLLHSRDRYEFGKNFKAGALAREIADATEQLAVATALIGLDDTNKQFIQIYADDRKVYRAYKMTLTEGQWTLERHAPDFHQRLEARFEDPGKRIVASWQKSVDGRNRELDFNLLFERVD